MTSQMTDNKETEGFAMHKTFERRLKSAGFLGQGQRAPPVGESARGLHSFFGGILLLTNYTYKRPQTKIFLSPVTRGQQEKIIRHQLKTRAQLLPRMADRLCLHRRCVEYLATGNFYLLA